MGIVAGRQLLAFGHWLLARISTLFQSTNGQLAKSQKPPFHKKTARSMQAPGGPLAAKGGQSVSALLHGWFWWKRIYGRVAPVFSPSEESLCEAAAVCCSRNSTIVFTSAGGRCRVCLFNLLYLLYCVTATGSCASSSVSDAVM